MGTFQTSRSLPHSNISLAALLGLPSELALTTLCTSLFTVFPWTSYRFLTMTLWIAQDQDHRMGIIISEYFQKACPENMQWTPLTTGL